MTEQMNHQAGDLGQLLGETTMPLEIVLREKEVDWHELTGSYLD